MQEIFVPRVLGSLDDDRAAHPADRLEGLAAGHLAAERDRGLRALAEALDEAGSLVGEIEDVEQEFGISLRERWGWR